MRNDIEKLADKIKQLINITESLLLYAKQLKELNNKYLPTNIICKSKYSSENIPLMLIFLHCTFYYDALLNLNTLLQPLQKDINKKEQSIFELIEMESDTERKNNLLETANELKKKLKDKNLDKWRNKLVGHKDIQSAGDTEMMYSNFIKDTNFDYSIKLLNGIKDFVTQNYDVICNNPFAGLYDESFTRMIELFENELN